MLWASTGLVTGACIRQDLIALKEAVSKDIVNLKMEVQVQGHNTVYTLTVINIATGCGFMDGVKWLVEEMGVSIDNDAAMHAIRRGQLTCLQYLVEHGANITTLFKSAITLHAMEDPESRQADCLRFLFQRGATLDHITRRSLDIPPWIPLYESELRRKRNNCVATSVAFYHIVKKRRMPHDLAKQMTQHMIRSTWNDDCWRDDE